MKRIILAVSVMAAVAFVAVNVETGCGSSSETPDAGTPDAGQSSAKLTRGPWMTTVTAEGINLSWETDKAARPEVKVSGASSASFTGTSAKHTYDIGMPVKTVTVYQHNVTLTGLKAASTYQYAIPDIKTSTTGSFVTAPATAVPFAFAVYGDSRGPLPMEKDLPIHAAITGAMAKRKPEFYVHTGDMPFTGGSADDWYLFFKTSSGLMPLSPIYPTWGNHEEGGEESWKTFFNLPGDGGQNRYYSFDFSNAHFSVICSECGIAASDAQISWLKADMEKASKTSGIDHIFVVYHDPAYTYSEHGNNEETIANIVPLMKQYGVKIAFAGHNHLYEHIVKDGIHHMTLGGGGAPLYNEDNDVPPEVVWKKAYHYSTVEVNGKSVSVKAIDDSGTQIDSYSY
ncbi:MAG: metallophosphoesterase family protein [Myxococcota bacterium]|jgi:hypothetical protein